MTSFLSRNISFSGYLRNCYVIARQVFMTQYVCFNSINIFRTTRCARHTNTMPFSLSADPVVPSFAINRSGMLGLEAWPRPRGQKPDLGLGHGLVCCGLGLGLGLVGFGLSLVGFGLEPRGLSRPTTETEQNVIGSKSINNEFTEVSHAAANRKLVLHLA